MKSQEGTRKGCPYAIPEFAFAIMLVLSCINLDGNGLKIMLKQVAFADHITNIRDLLKLNESWDKIIEIGPKCGDYHKATKSWLIVKNEYVRILPELFMDTQINITSESRNKLGVAVGSEEYRNDYISEKAEKGGENTNPKQYSHGQPS